VQDMPAYILGLPSLALGLGFWFAARSMSRQADMNEQQIRLIRFVRFGSIGLLACGVLLLSGYFLFESG
jgi:hypothetical protein